jgi:hypothetical protein
MRILVNGDHKVSVSVLNSGPASLLNVGLGHSFWFSHHCQIPLACIHIFCIALPLRLIAMLFTCIVGPANQGSCIILRVGNLAD